MARRRNSMLYWVLLATAVIASCSALSLLKASQPRLSETELAAALAGKYDAEAEVRMWDGTRCDLLSDEYAYEVEWASNQYQSFGQASWYSIATGRKPAVILLVRSFRDDSRHIYRALAISERLGIKVHLELTR